MDHKARNVFMNNVNWGTTYLSVHHRTKLSHLQSYVGFSNVNRFDAWCFLKERISEAVTWQDAKSRYLLLHYTENCPCVKPLVLLIQFRHPDGNESGGGSVLQCIFILAFIFQKTRLNWKKRIPLFMARFHHSLLSITDFLKLLIITDSRYRSWQSW